PGVIAQLAFLGNGMKDPEALAGAHVKAANVSFVIAHALWRETFTKGRADNDGVFGHDGRRLKPDFTGSDVGHESLVIIHLEIHRAIVAEGGNRGAGLCVEADEPVAGRYIKDALVVSLAIARCIRPIGKAASGELARGRGAASTFAFA